MLLLAFSAPLAAGQVVVRGLRLWDAPDHSRFVLDISAPAQYTLFPLTNPQRLVIDIASARLAGSYPQPDQASPLLQGIRSAIREGGKLRVVLDLKIRVRPQSFLLPPNSKYGHRLVIDLYPADQESAEPKPYASIGEGDRDGLRDVIIAIDAGHGGEDPGARGPEGTREKDVVLAVARRLEKLMRKEPGMRPVMIRKGDYYIPLQRRIRLARENKAELFISIHADAFRDRKVSGSSVYTLSERGASDEAARFLAKRENAADLIGGVSLEGKDDLLTSVLVDLSQRAAIEASVEAAGDVLRALTRVGKTHKRSVQQAGFQVLKSPDIPSILIETAFISNRAEERKLRNPKRQQALAKAIMDGIRIYFRRRPPRGALLAAGEHTLAEREYIIVRGDTLSRIAQRYQVSLKHIRAVNSLAGDRIRVGQVLRIPGAGDS